jgi:NAD(P)-dependent dehydrogenase (short-subunit alcohol dehydrogenase family)
MTDGRGGEMQDAGRPYRLEGRVALVTGAAGTNSLGRSIALRLAAEGAAIRALDVSAERASLVADEIVAAGGRATSTLWVAPPTLLPHIASKGGVIGLTRAMARELGTAGIRVNAIAPGFTLTQTNLEQGGDVMERADATRQGQCLNQRNTVADDLAGPVFFLASSDSDWMTGQTLLVDGGLNFN